MVVDDVGFVGLSGWWGRRLILTVGCTSVRCTMRCGSWYTCVYEEYYHKMGPSILHACKMHSSHMNSMWVPHMHYSCEGDVSYMHVR